MGTPRRAAPLKAWLVAVALVALGRAAHADEPQKVELDDLPEDVRSELFKKPGEDGGSSLDGVTPEEYCEGCKLVMAEVNNQLDIKEHRTLGETNAYFDEMCDDIRGWYPEYVYKVCNDLIPKHTLTIRGLVTMIAGNLEDSVCSLYLKVCPKYEGPNLPPGGVQPEKVKRSKKKKNKTEL